MKALALGAVVGLVWVVFGVPLAPVATVLAAVVKPVTATFLLGLAARPHITRWRTS